MVHVSSALLALQQGTLQSDAEIGLALRQARMNVMGIVAASMESCGRLIP